MTTIHNLGFPRIGVRRELKFALERYWRGDIERSELEAIGRDLRAHHWRQQAEAGVDLVPVGDFSWYDHVLDTACLVGAVPPRFEHDGGPVDLDTYFRMARGRAPSGADTAACELTKWFDTNYHYLVPELAAGQRFELSADWLFEQVREAQALGLTPKPVLLGPLSFLWLSKTEDEAPKLDLLPALLEVYGEVLERLRAQDVTWVQIDEPILALDLDEDWQKAFEPTYNRLQTRALNILLATYFGPLANNLDMAARLPVAGLHVDLVRAPEQLTTVLDRLPVYKILSAGVVDGRNVWRTDLDAVLAQLRRARERLGDRLWLAPSCSLLHSPVDLHAETELDPELREWLAFAAQKLDELALLRAALDGEARDDQLAAHRRAVAARYTSPRRIDPAVRDRLNALRDVPPQRAPFAEREPLQRQRLNLPLYPTTTIGSFPQTADIRQARAAWRAGRLDDAAYETRMREEIAAVVRTQERIGLDVLVHGEPERNDMVEYFGELLEGFLTTRNGWVQSYGSRCVKPPIIYGDVHRTQPMTVQWAQYAQSLTDKPMKGMLTGPTTILQWSFVRDDQPRQDTAYQIALALRDEVADLEAAGINIIQIDEPAFREGLPLRRSEHDRYFEWATGAFRFAAEGARSETQIHTHMCYSQFNGILPAIAALDADVITIETARSNMELLDGFMAYRYPNAIGPGIYDIHSPVVPRVDALAERLRLAAQRVPPERLWANPDCGLKTRAWPEVEASLEKLVTAARRVRAETLSAPSAVAGR